MSTKAEHTTRTAACDEVIGAVATQNAAVRFTGPSAGAADSGVVAIWRGDVRRRDVGARDVVLVVQVRLDTTTRSPSAP